MPPNSPPLRVGIYGSDDQVRAPGRGCGLWAPGYAPAVTAAGGTPVELHLRPGCSWDDLLDDLDAVIFAGSRAPGAAQPADEERLCQWCRQFGLPLLAVGQGLHVLNRTYGGTLHDHLPRDLPEALQHRHPLEEGLRHALDVVPGTRLAAIYGDGEIIVNSEHVRAVCQVGGGFKVSGRALDGVIEAIEPEDDGWFALGVQWHPASASASGLDIQLFRGLLEACGPRRGRAVAA